MAQIVTRLSKNTALTFGEVDANFTGLNTELELVHANTYIQIPSAGGLPATAENGALVEVLNTTDIESLALVSGAPAGFVGSAQFTARLKYALSTATNNVPAPGRWQWIDYSHRDPNARYAPQGLEAQLVALAAQVAILEERVLAASAVGDVKFTTLATNPPGWIEANGAVLNRIVYAELFEVFGTRYGAGNGTTTFRIPDYRGRFLRGLDNGRGLDPGRVQGSDQGDQNKRQVISPVVTQPTVNQPTVNQPTITQPTVNQPTVTGPTITHDLTVGYNSNPIPGTSGGGSASDLGGTGSTRSVAGTITAGAVTLSNITLGPVGLSNITLTPITLTNVGVADIEVAGGDEARVKNVAERPIIKAFSRAANVTIAPADVRLLLHLNGNLSDSSLYQSSPNASFGFPPPTFVGTPVFFPGQAARFAGGNSVAWSLDNDLTGEFCISAKVTISGDSFVYVLGSNPSSGYFQGLASVRVGSNGNVVVEYQEPYVPGQQIMSAPAGTIPFGQYIDLAWTRSASGTQRLYLDGNLIASGSATPSGISLGNILALGHPSSDFTMQELRLLYKDPYNGQSFVPPAQRYPNP